MTQGIYTVSTTPVKGREYTNNYGTALTVWRLGLQDAESAAPDKLFELHKKKAPPAKGEQIEVERVQTGEFNGEAYTRLYLVDTYNKPDSGGSSKADPPDRFDRKPEHPRNEARMIHTSALSATPGYINSAVAFGAIDGETLEPTAKWDVYWRLVGKVATKLVRSYEPAMDPQQSMPVPPPKPAEEVPADQDGLEPQPALAGADGDENIPF